jgi:hypothetical protein
MLRNTIDSLTARCIRLISLSQELNAIAKAKGYFFIIFNKLIDSPKGTIEQ